MRRSALYCCFACFLVLSACRGGSDLGHQHFGVDATDVVLNLPVTTASEAAYQNFVQGLHAADMGRASDAASFFKEAVQADPLFSLAYLHLASASPDLDGFSENLDRAESAASDATTAEKLLVQVVRRGFDADLEGAAAVAWELVHSASESPRAWLALAEAQTGLGRFDSARESALQAVELAPLMAAAHLSAARTHLAGEEPDLDTAEEHAARAAELAPNEPVVHDLLGGIHRRQGALVLARDDFSRTTSVASSDPAPYAQRAYLSTLLGHYREALADYEKAISLSSGRSAAVLHIQRGYVHLHEVNPKAALESLQDASREIGRLDLPDPLPLQVRALEEAVLVALHFELTDWADLVLSDYEKLIKRQAEEVGSSDFTREGKANLALHRAVLAARRGDFVAAAEQARKIARLVEPLPAADRIEPMHYAMGVIELERGRGVEALGHLENAGEHAYVSYLKALALDSVGRTSEAEALFVELATRGDNDLTAALTRRDALKRLASSAAA